MSSQHTKEQLKTALFEGDQKWKHLEVLHKYVKQDRQSVRNALADLMVDGTVQVNMDPRNGRPVFALRVRTSEEHSKKM